MRARKSRLPSPIKMASQNRPAMANTRLSGVSRPICISLPATAAIMTGAATAAALHSFCEAALAAAIDHTGLDPGQSLTSHFAIAVLDACTGGLDGQQAARPCQRHRDA